MICKRCGKNNAEIYYKQTVNGHTEEYVLCAQCADELKKQGKLNIGTSGFFDDFGFGKESSFFGLSDIFGLPRGSGRTKQSEKKKCTLCASTFDDLVRNGKVGCAKCYEVFSDELRGSVESIHGKAKYMGKIPKRFKAKETKADKLKALKAEMDGAIKSQEFERAAELRDAIRALEQED